MTITVQIIQEGQQPSHFNVEAVPRIGEAVRVNGESRRVTGVLHVLDSEPTSIIVYAR